MSVEGQSDNDGARARAVPLRGGGHRLGGVEGGRAGIDDRDDQSKHRLMGRVLSTNHGRLATTVMNAECLRSKRPTVAGRG